MKYLQLLSLCLFLIGCSKRELEVGAPRVDNVRMNQLLSLLPPPGQEPLVGYAGVNGTTTGGAGGPVVTVDNLTDLINYAQAPGPLIIQVAGTIIGSGNDRVWVRSDKTVTGLTGATLRGVGISIYNVSNVIVRNLQIEYVRTNSNIIIKDGAHHVWIDHCYLRNEINKDYGYYDGLLDIGGSDERVSNYVTVSWCKFSDSDKASLIGSQTRANDSTSNLTTFHHNLYEQVIERCPKVYQTTNHVFNNYYRNNAAHGAYQGYAIAGTFGGTILAENNYFDNILGKPLITNYNYPDEPVGFIIDSNNYVAPGGGPKIITTTPPSYTPPYSYTLTPVMDVPALVMARAGTYSTGSNGPVYQSEQGILLGGTLIDTAYGGYHGLGYVELPLTGGSVELSNVDGQGGGLKKLTFRYSLLDTARTAQLVVNGGTPIQLRAVSTGSWTTWNTISATVPLNNNSTNTVKLVSSRQGWGLLDKVVISAASISLPVFSSQPIAQTVNAGSNVTFTTAASGPSPLTYQWEKNGVNIPGATLPTFTITNAIGIDSGTYRVMVTNPGGSVTSDPAKLTVIVPPVDVYQFEAGTLAGGAVTEAIEPGYHGTGYIKLPLSGGSIQINNIDGRYNGMKTLTLRYSLEGTARNAQVIINGGTPIPIAPPSTGAWDSWATISMPFPLPNNTNNTLKIETSGEGFGYLDEITVE